MAHEFESGFFVARGAWHGLGTTLDSPPSTQDAVVKAGLNWQVLERPLSQQSEDSAGDASRKLLVRDCDQSVLGTVDSDYIPLQNHDAFRWFNPLIEKGGMTLEAAGSLQGGRRVWILAKINRMEGRVGKDDLIRPYLLLHNSHDGSTAVWLQFTPIRVVCMNTLASAAVSRFRDLWNKKSACVPHTASLEEQMYKIRSLVDRSKLEFQMSVEDYQAMAELEADDKMLSSYMGSVLRIAQPQQRLEWSQILHNFESGRGNKGKTLWDAYNAVTEWIDHQQETSAEERLLSTWFGSGATIREAAHREAMALVKESPACDAAYDRRQHLVSKQLRRRTLSQDLQTKLDQIRAARSPQLTSKTKSVTPIEHPKAGI